jgi:2-hydroxychromene-2-carboxylate isomerase
MAAPLRFYFDFISPYAYLGWTQVHALADRYGRTVAPVPILFAALLNHHGHKGPAEIPPKRLYVFKNASRIAHRMGVPLLPPPAHPFNPLLALRAASLPMEDEARRRLIDALFAAVWGGGPGVIEPAAVAACAEAAGLDGAALVRAAGADEAKLRVRRQTDEAIAAGIFGVPTFGADGEPFWGCDAIPDLEAFLRGEDPIDQAAVARWAGLPAAATRRSPAPAPAGGAGRPG